MMNPVASYMHDTERVLRLWAATGDDELRLIETSADMLEAQRRLLEACEP